MTTCQSYAWPGFVNRTDRTTRLQKRTKEAGRRRPVQTERDGEAKLI